MKTLKIRFVAREKDYLIQRKTWFGWRYYRWLHDFGYGGAGYLACKDTKEELLEDVLENWHRVDKRFVTIIEYPSLKMY